MVCAMMFFSSGQPFNGWTVKHSQSGRSQECASGAILSSFSFRPDCFELMGIHNHAVEIEEMSDPRLDILALNLSCEAIGYD